MRGVEPSVGSLPSPRPNRTIPPQRSGARLTTSRVPIHTAPQKRIGDYSGATNAAAGVRTGSACTLLGLNVRRRVVRYVTSVVSLLVPVVALIGCGVPLPVLTGFGGLYIGSEIATLDVIDGCVWLDGVAFCEDDDDPDNGGSDGGHEGNGDVVGDGMDDGHRPPGDRPPDNRPPDHAAGGDSGGMGPNTPDAPGDGDDEDGDSGTGEGNPTDGESDRFTICHRPGCPVETPDSPHSPSGQTIEVSSNALDAHLAHDDTIGACE